MTVRQEWIANIVRIAKLLAISVEEDFALMDEGDLENLADYMVELGEPIIEGRAAAAAEEAAKAEVQAKVLAIIEEERALARAGDPTAVSTTEK